MKQKAVIHEINVYRKNDGRFWYLNCFVKIGDGADVGEKSRPSQLIRASSFLPLWGSKKFNKKANALHDVSRWRGIVCEVISKDYIVDDVPQQEPFNDNPTTADDLSIAIDNNALDALADNLVATASRASANDTEELMDPHISAEVAVEAMNVVDEALVTVLRLKRPTYVLN